MIRVPSHRRQQVNRIIVAHAPVDGRTSLVYLVHAPVRIVRRQIYRNRARPTMRRSKRQSNTYAHIPTHPHTCPDRYGSFLSPFAFALAAPPHPFMYTLLLSPPALSSLPLHSISSPLLHHPLNGGRNAMRFFLWHTPIWPPYTHTGTAVLDSKSLAHFWSFTASFFRCGDFWTAPKSQQREEAKHHKNGRKIYV